jgi:hypothetical protein
MISQVYALLAPPAPSTSGTYSLDRVHELTIADLGLIGICGSTISAPETIAVNAATQAARWFIEKNQTPTLFDIAFRDLPVELITPGTTIYGRSLTQRMRCALVALAQVRGQPS